MEGDSPDFNDGRFLLNQTIILDNQGRHAGQNGGQL